MGLLKNTSSKANSKLNTYKKDEPGLSVSGAQPKPANSAASQPQSSL